MREFYFYTENKINKTIEEVFTDFKIHTISKEVLLTNTLTNKNILLFLNENLPKDLNDFFFMKNNAVIFFLKQNSRDKKKYYNTKIFTSCTNINKFKDEVITFFVSKSFIYKNIIIKEEKVINTKSKKDVYLTPLEKDILILLFEKKKIEKKILLENVLKFREDTETKTIESHLTRIRKKLSSINSSIEIITRENIVFLVI